MNNSKKILSIFRNLTSVAVAIPSAICASSCAHSSIKLNKLLSYGDTNGSSHFYLTSQKHINAREKVNYNFSVDYSDYDWTGYVTLPGTWGVLFISKGDYVFTESETLPLLSATVKIDGVTLKQVSKDSGFIDQTFLIKDSLSANDSIILYQKIGLTKTSKIQISIKLKSGFNDCVPILIPSKLI